MEQHFQLRPGRGELGPRGKPMQAAKPLVAGATRPVLPKLLPVPVRRVVAPLTVTAASGAVPQGSAKSKPETNSTNSTPPETLTSTPVTDSNGARSGPRAGVRHRNPAHDQILEKFVVDMGGDRPIHSVLIANNGLAAVKFMRSVRSWASQALGAARAITLVAMATPDDMRVNAEHIQLADQFVEVPGGTNNNNYANVELIVEIAKRAGVDAVWPGWGHASENPDLPSSLEALGIRFLGPPAGPMAALGDKIGSTLLAQAAGVPTIPWSGSEVPVTIEQCGGGVIPPAAYTAACVDSEEAAAASAAKIGYPVMLKASWGGGGKGIRKVSSDDELRAAFKQVAGEVPGSPIFVMKLARTSRHLEVQLVADRHGNVTSLFTRDCSVQRRHQKIIEEGPATAAPPEQLRDMERCARALARLVGYQGAATVEYLYAIDEKKYYFLELNPRLQVEHPVTEGITGVNLPATQLMIGMGIPLTRINTIRALYGKDPAGSDHFDIEATPQVLPNQHVVAVRLTAEDAGDGFKPTAGRIDELVFRPTPEVWGYFSVQSGGGIHQYSDSQFGHLFAHAPSREEALRAMQVALGDVTVLGEIRTTTDYVLDLISSPDLVGNNINTGWLDARIAARVKPGSPPWHISVIAGAVVKSALAALTASSEYLAHLAKGHLPPSSLSLTRMAHAMVINGTKYTVSLTRRGPGLATVELNGSTVDVAYRSVNGDGFLIQVDGESHVIHYEEEPGGTRLLINGLTLLLAKEVDPTRLTSASPGKLVRRLLPNGAKVARGQAYAEVEVMKMVMPLLAQNPGTIKWVAPEGCVVAAGELLASLALEAGAVVAAPEPFTGAFPELGPPQLPSARVDAVFASALEHAKNILAGYVDKPAKVVEELVRCLDSPGLALLQWQDQLAVVHNKLPGGLVAALEAAVDAHAQEVAQAMAAATASAGTIDEGGALGVGVLMSIEGGGLTAAAAAAAAAAARCRNFPSAAVSAVMERALAEAAPADRNGLQVALEPLFRVASEHAGGRSAYGRAAVGSLLESFLAVEEAYLAARCTAGLDYWVTTDQEAVDALRKQHQGRLQEAVDALRKQHQGRLQAVLDLVVSHQGLELKVAFITALMARMVLPRPAPYRPLLQRLADLKPVPEMAELAARAAQLLEESHLADLRAQVAAALSGLEMFTPGAASAAAAADSLAYDASAARRAGQGAIDVSHIATQPSGLESQVEHLVGSAAAVEDALAALVVDSRGAPPALRRRAALTYIERLYSPFMITRPMVQQVGDGSLLAVWMFDDPEAANTPRATQRLAALLMVDRLQQLNEGIDAAGELLADLSASAGGACSVGTLHVALSGTAKRETKRDDATTADYCDIELMKKLGGKDKRAVAANVAVATSSTKIDSSGTGMTISGAQEAAKTGVVKAEKNSKEGGKEAAKGASPPAALVNAATAVAGKSSSDRVLIGGSISPSASIDVMLPPADQVVEESRATATAINFAIHSAGAKLASIGFSHVSVLAPGSTAMPMRLGWAWTTTSTGGSYQPDSFISTVEPVTASLLELSRFSAVAAAAHAAHRDSAEGKVASAGAGVGKEAAGTGLPSLMYRPSRSHQWHLFTVQEQKDVRSPPLRRLFACGLVRALGHPELLAASYSGNGHSVAVAAVTEVEEALANCLKELEASMTPENAGVENPADSTRPDWTSIYMNVLTPLPLSPGGRDDVRVASALRSAAAAIVTRHGAALRQAAVAVWETRLRGPLREAAWRVVVSMPTGHEHGEQHVEVYREVPADPASFTRSPTRVPRTYMPAPAFATATAAAAAAAAATAEGGAAAAAVPVYNNIAPFSAAGAAQDGPVKAMTVDNRGRRAPANYPLAGTLVGAPFPPLAPLMQKRLAARKHNVTYVYDYPGVFEAALQDLWAARSAAGEPNSILPAAQLVETVELVLPQQPLLGLDKNGNRAMGPCTNFRSPPRLRPAPAGRPLVGGNDCGMVCWLMTLRTPECPQGRTVVAVANDITWASGSFSPAEDAVFRAACEYALEERLPLVYLAANSGARVGLANEVRDCLQVHWRDPAQPEAGWEYLYLTERDYLRLTQNTPVGAAPCVRAEPRATPDGTHYVVTDVVGNEDGIGVECLSGSAAIASAFCRTWREGYTVTLVSGRTVGIGAYLARLGRRVVQRADQPVVLTGYAALNKLLGRQVYTSHMQLGGPRVMGFNGVSHHVVADDLEGVTTVLRLLSYAPAATGVAPQPLPTADPVDRPVTYAPGPSEKLDARAAIAGRESATGWQSGLFDKGSWLESQAGWARTVVTGRARLGGVPVGVIGVESATVMREVPADPGLPESSESVVPQAGQVWYPDSADKTAAAMEEFAAEGLPLFILANWRGFSGGQRDLFDGVLQAGSLIVERLRTYKHPVFVYIPTGAELRGGAWVVIDRQINAGAVETFADPTARGGVLEPEGIVEIKFRTPDLVKLMHRTDPTIVALRAAGTTAADPAIRARERELLPTYSRIARTFADMHDTPIRMAAKGVLDAIVPFATSRSFFSTRLRRRLLEQQLLRHITTTDPSMPTARAQRMLQAWRDAAEVAASGKQGPAAEPVDSVAAAQADVATSHDRAFLAWAESPMGRAVIAGELRALRRAAASDMVGQLLDTVEGKDGLMVALQSALARDAMLAVQLKMLLNQAQQIATANNAAAAATQAALQQQMQQQQQQAALQQQMRDRQAQALQGGPQGGQGGQGAQGEGGSREQDGQALAGR
ncbi:hypothetical protein HYH03_012820 [Edaphochlamys debaryana]|uniref:Acetyl-CoA carboxylase n=1 Tax=Edaphochlamys debaryana TaxID=47281 RepID=A0A836BV38_9CHLO|nr:hypothetical protein HYH03_012820 [Edaphochlamys debaryana]KAG2488654.1 hypothetical protein HYH03_012820 [Edaphochlamys debaryana]|eukprot:KAG2488653.1 hypothetical protein HYH03_012820 [Edaphochlamys debaryana]